MREKSVVYILHIMNEALKTVCSLIYNQNDFITTRALGTLGTNILSKERKTGQK